MENNFGHPGQMLYLRVSPENSGHLLPLREGNSPEAFCFSLFKAFRITMAYVIKGGRKNVDLPYLPKAGTLKGDKEVVLDRYKENYETELHEIVRYIVNEEGDSYPQEDLSNVDDFRAYFLSHDVFVVLVKQTGEVLGGFYIKPNFPGRCSHICNVGFVAKATARGLGIGSFMMENFIILARDLGYKASFFNLVFVTNKASVRICRKYGFTETGIVPNAGNLKGKGYTDAYQFYMDFTKMSKL